MNYEMDTSYPLCSRVPNWKVFWRLLGFALVIMLLVAVLMSAIVTPKFQFNQPMFRQIEMLGVLLLFNMTILAPTLFEVWWVKAGVGGLKLRTLLGQRCLNWDEISSFTSAPHLRMGILKAGRCFYLLSKRDLENYAALEQMIVQSLTKARN